MVGCWQCCSGAAAALQWRWQLGQCIAAQPPIASFFQHQLNPHAQHPTKYGLRKFELTLTTFGFGVRSWEGFQGGLQPSAAGTHIIQPPLFALKLGIPTSKGVANTAVTLVWAESQPAWGQRSPESAPAHLQP